MPNLSTLSRGTQILAAAGVLLLIDMFLDWQSIDVGPFSVGENAWSGFWGIVMGLGLLVLLAWVIARVFDVKLPGELPEGLLHLGLVGLAGHAQHLVGVAPHSSYTSATKRESSDAAWRTAMIVRG